MQNRKWSLIVTWATDPELQDMFMSELADRSARLIAGGEAMMAGDVDDEVVTAMLREGHTVKGTGRVMGYPAIAGAGQRLELTWRRVQQDDLVPTVAIGAAVTALARALPDAGTADPEGGTPELMAAMRELGEALGEPDSIGQPRLRAVDPMDNESVDPSQENSRPEQPARPASTIESKGTERTAAAPSPPASTKAVAGSASVAPQVPLVRTTIADSPPAIAREFDEVSTQEPEARPPKLDDPVHSPQSDSKGLRHADNEGAASSRAPSADPAVAEELAELLGAIDSWAGVDTLPVSAGRLYRLINLVASIRNDLETVQDKLEAVRNSDDLEALESRFVPMMVAANELEHDAMQLSAVPFASMTNTLPQLVRFVGKKLGKDVRFDISGDSDVVIDRQVLDKIADPLRQLVVNSIRHGIEIPRLRLESGKSATGFVSVTATVKDRRLQLAVSDDGAGIDWPAVGSAAVAGGLLSVQAASDPRQLNQVLFRSGFSTAVDGDLAHPGNGLAAVTEVVESLFGRVQLESTPGVGTTVTVTVPTSRALQRIFLFESVGMKWGIPESVVENVIAIDNAGIEWRVAEPSLVWKGEVIPIAPFDELVGATEAGQPQHVLIVSHRVGSVAIMATRVAGVHEVVVKEVGPLLAGPPHITGAVLFGGDEVVLVLDAVALVSSRRKAGVSDAVQDRVLVVDDSMGARAVVSGALASSGFATSVAASAREAMDLLSGSEVDALVVDFSMPHEDGAQLVARVRQAGLSIPVVMLSGVADEDDRNRAKAAGVDVFFHKSDFREAALAETLRRLLGQVTTSV